MKTHWIDITGSIETTDSLDDFNEAFIQFIEQRGEQFIGSMKEQE